MAMLKYWNVGGVEGTPGEELEVKPSNPKYGIKENSIVLIVDCVEE